MKDMWSRLLGVVQRHLTRPRRIVLDLVLTAVLLGVLWWWYDYPLPMGPEGQLRRMERRELLQPGEIVYTLPRERGRREPAKLTRELVVSMGEDWAALGWLGGREGHSYLAEFSGERMVDGAMRQVEWAFQITDVPTRWLEVYPLEEGPQVLPLTWPIPLEGGAEAPDWGFLGVRLPQGTTGGTLGLTLPDGTVRTLTGQGAGEKSLLFALEDGAVDWRTCSPKTLWADAWGRALEGPWMAGLSYTLTLTDGGGRPLYTKEGRLPAPQ